VEVDLRATRAWEFARFSFELGLAIGGGATYSRFWDEAVVAAVAHIDATMGMNVPLWNRTYLGFELAAQTLGVAWPHQVGESRDPADPRATARVTNPEPLAILRASLLLGVWL
jgi:hypothetical protein